MSWQLEITEMVRLLIGDLSDTPTYCDERIQRTILLSAQQLINEFAFCVTYTPNIVTLTLSPDPTSDPRDEGFIYLLALKTASLIVSGELRRYAVSSISVTDGPSSVQMGGIFKNLQELSKDIGSKYDKALMLFRMNGCEGPNGQGYGQAIFGPTTDETILPGRFI